MTPLKNILFAALCLALILIRPAFSSVLTLHDYLSQVKKENFNSLSNLQAQASGQEIQAEKDLLIAPTLFATSNARFDRSQPQQPGVSYHFQRSFVSTIGINKKTLFGSQIELGYELDYLTLAGVRFGGVAIPDFMLFTSRPYITLTQSLWQNGSGRLSQAQYDQLGSQGLAQSYQAQFTQESLLVNAETSYWGLVVGIEQIRIYEKSVAQSKKVLDWNTTRRAHNLNQISDSLQAKAAYESHLLELESAKNRVRELAQSFNEMRHLLSSEVTETLETLPEADKIEIPTLAPEYIRSDIRAAAENMKVAASNAALSIEKDKPQLDLTFTYARSGQNLDLAQAVGAITYPASTLGLKFTMPLDFEARSRAKRGWIAAKISAEATYDQKMFDGKNDREDLVLKMKEAKNRLFLATQIAGTQTEKLENENVQFKRGRTTTYQVLVFEGDLLQARLQKVNATSDLLKLISQAKLYSAGLTSP